MAIGDVLTSLLVTSIFVFSVVIYLKVRLSWVFAAIITVIEFVQLINIMANLDNPPAGITVLTIFITFLWLAKTSKEFDRSIIRRE